MENIKIKNFLIILTLVFLTFSQSQSQSFDLKSLPDAYEEFNYNLGGQIFAASQIGEDSLIIGSYKQSPLYFYDVKNNTTRPLNSELKLDCNDGSGHCNQNIQHNLIQMHEGILYVIGNDEKDVGLFKSSDLGNTWTFVSNNIKYEFYISDSTIFYKSGFGASGKVESAQLSDPDKTSTILNRSDITPEGSVWTSYDRFKIINNKLYYSYWDFNSNNQMISGIIIADIENGEIKNKKHYRTPFNLSIRNYAVHNSDTLVIHGHLRSDGSKNGFYLFDINSESWDLMTNSTGGDANTIIPMFENYFINFEDRFVHIYSLNESSVKKLNLPENYDNYPLAIKISKNKIFCFGGDKNLIFDFTDFSTSNEPSVYESNIAYNYKYYNKIIEIDSLNLVLLKYKSNSFSIDKINIKTTSVEKFEAAPSDDYYAVSSLFFIENNKFIHHLVNYGNNNYLGMYKYNLSTGASSKLFLIQWQGNTETPKDLIFYKDTYFLLSSKVENDLLVSSMTKLDTNGNQLEKLELNSVSKPTDYKWHDYNSKFQETLDSLIFITDLFRINIGSGWSNSKKEIVFNTLNNNITTIPNEIMPYAEGTPYYNAYLDSNKIKIDQNTKYGNDYVTDDLITWTQTDEFSELEKIFPELMNETIYYFNTASFKIAYSIRYNYIYYFKPPTKWRRVVFELDSYNYFGGVNDKSGVTKSDYYKDVIYISGQRTKPFILKLFNLPLNLPPKLEEITGKTINEDEATNVTLVATDVDGDPISYSGFADKSAVNVIVESNVLKISPDKDWNGSSIITAVASDAYASDSVTFVLNVNPVQDAPYPFDWLSTASDSIDITQSNLTDAYKLKWNTSKEVDNEVVDYLIYVQIGKMQVEMVHDTTDTSYAITYQEFLENVFEPFPMLSRATVRFSISATDGIDTVKVTGDDRVVFVNRYDYLSTESEGIPTEFALHENYPNPFNPTTTLRFDLPDISDITLTIYNMLGQKVRTFIMQSTPAGYHSVKWDATNDYGEQVGAGVYLYQLQTKDFVKTRKMVLLK